MIRFSAAIALITLLPALTLADPTLTRIAASADGFELTRAGQPYFIRGAGGDAPKSLLKDSGGNSFRTWGADGLDAKLDEAQKLGLSVTVGIWLQHPGRSWKYSNADQVKAQFEMAKAAILKYKDHPAVLMWGIGNEMEGPDGSDPAVWNAVEDIAKFAHSVDSNHPTMTVIAEMGGKKIHNINQYCPDIDVIGINSYGGGPSLAQRYRATGSNKPYVVTEFGPPGSWESGTNKWGAPFELTSTAKGNAYRETYEKSIAAEKGKLCLGSYAFAWGSKREASATWFGIFLADNARLEALDVMTSLWNDRPLEKHCPQIDPLKVDRDSAKPGEAVHVTLHVTDPQARPMSVKWVLQKDPAQYNTAGEVQAEQKTYPDAIVRGNLEGCDLKLPGDAGGLWLYAIVDDGQGDAAVANVPLHVEGPASRPAAPTPALPLVLYGDDEKKPPYIPSGWMGNVAAIAVDEKCGDKPHAGATCMKCELKSADGFGGVVWQNPANDWGDQPGGYNLSAARRLSFWARGAQGGEKLTFKVGIINSDKPFPDSDRASLDVILEADWKQFTIDLTDKDLSCIKTGFGWVAAGKPVTFYLDDVQFEAAPRTTQPAVKGEPATLPFALYEDGLQKPPYTPAGRMGDTASIAVDDKCDQHPHAGKSCMKCEFKSDHGFGGVVWQSPANDWGEQPGGFDLTGAKKLTFWARGDAGGETVSFSLGILGKDKKYHDSAVAKLPGQTLSTDWTQYSIDLAGKDLTDIKTGFCWVVESKGKPVTFYLDDIRFE